MKKASQSQMASDTRDSHGQSTAQQKKNAEMHVVVVNDDLDLL